MHKAATTSAATAPASAAATFATSAAATAAATRCRAATAARLAISGSEQQQLSLLRHRCRVTPPEPAPLPRLQHLGRVSHRAPLTRLVARLAAAVMRL